MESEFSFRTRNADIEAIAGGECEVLIIGGGISGAGIANILAQNGVRTVLVDRSDFASGTSSGSSKLIHGGLRYLAMGEFREVRDLLRERNYLTRNTGIVEPLKFHIIVDSNSWSKGTLRIGLFLYYLLGGHLKIPRFIRNEGIYQESVEGYFEYSDSLTDDSKLVIYNIVSARRRGAICLNYVVAEDFRKEAGGTIVNLKDTTNGKEFSIRPEIIINAGGPWAGEIMKKMSLNINGSLRLSKGIHIVVPSEKMPLKNAVAFRTPIDRRQMFIIPRGEVVHIGTTDTFVNSPEDFSISEEDLEYVVKSASYLFPGISRKDIITAYSGIRPLFGSGDDPGKISRDFEIKQDGNFINVLGGKITNYRTASRKTARVVSRLLGKSFLIKGKPTIEYSRPEDGDLIESVIMNECPLTLEDIMRRRLGYRIYSLDSGSSIEPEVIRAMVKTGLLEENQ